MLTPYFTISQDDNFVIVCMQVKYVKVGGSATEFWSHKASECEFYMEDKLFKFHCRPYFLRYRYSLPLIIFTIRLKLPKPVIEDGTEKATYDIDKGLLYAYLPKLEKGVVFPDLDMITELLRVEDPSKNPLIEVVDGPNSNKSIGDDSMEMDDPGTPHCIRTR